MGSLLAELDRVSWTVLLAGLGLGAVWLVEMRIGAPLAVLSVALGVFLCLLRVRWLEAGVLMATTGLVPTLAYFAFGNPPVPRSDEPSIALVVPGAALMLAVIGLAVVAWWIADTAWSGRGQRAREEARKRRRHDRLAHRRP